MIRRNTEEEIKNSPSVALLFSTVFLRVPLPFKICQV